jgi:hypothetical protein
VFRVCALFRGCAEGVRPVGGVCGGCAWCADCGDVWEPYSATTVGADPKPKLEPTRMCLALISGFLGCLGFHMNIPAFKITRPGVLLAL